MRTTTTILAVGATVFALPTAAFAAPQSSMQVPLAGHLTVASQMETAHTELAQQRLTRKAWRLADRLADVRERGFSPRAYRRRVRDEAPARLAHRVRALRQDIRAARRAAERAQERRRARARARAVASPVLEAIAACESGGNPGANTGNGFYGKYQFDLATWASVGGTGNPAAASEAEQNRRATMLYARAGASPWPVCGR
jgi:hypothetical protein